MSSCSGSIMVYAMMLMSFMFHLVCQDTTHFFFLILRFLSKIDSSLSMHHWELVARIGAFTFLLWAIPEWWLSRAHPPSASPSHRSLKPVLSTSGIHRCPSAVSSASLPTSLLLSVLLFPFSQAPTPPYSFSSLCRTALINPPWDVRQ